jgi:transcriptional regulator with XRE-family HTH domain
MIVDQGMSGRIEAIVNPGMLRWARESAGFDLETAAKKIQVKAERLESWEAGDSRPTIKQLRNLGRAYKRPIAVFYLPEPPRDFQVSRDFRRLPGQVAGLASPELRFEMRRAQNRREVAVELFELAGDNLPGFPLQATLADDTERVAREIREFLGVTYDAQIGWKPAPNYESFNNWRATLESAGILVFQVTEVDVHEVRGFSLTELPLPAIVINNKDSLSGRTFTMLHELAHILLRQGGVCDLYEDVPRPPEEQSVEVFCNRVAAATLLPREDLLNEAMNQSQNS